MKKLLQIFSVSIFLLIGLFAACFSYVPKSNACIPDPNNPGSCIFFGCGANGQCSIWTAGPKFILPNCNNSCIIPPTPTPSPQPPTPTSQWIPDSQVTLAGKGAARSMTFLDWSLSNFQWAASDTSISQFWVKVRNITYAVVFLGMIISALIVILSHGTKMTAFHAIRRLFFAILLITLSFALMRFLYQVTDILQAFFNKNSQGALISSKDLLNLGFDYQSFQGVRLAGDANNEQALVMINLAKLTAITYDVIGGILLMRKIILWFYIIVSPVICLLILFLPAKSFLKGCVNEFLRWVFYAPIFMILLSGLVFLWQSNLSVLPFHFSPNAKQVYPTATNLLLGGPGQQVSMTNTLNYPDTFIEYVVSLIMLWVVIVLPFILMKLGIKYLTEFTETNDKYLLIKKQLDSLPFFLQNFRDKSGYASQKSTNLQTPKSYTSPFTSSQSIKNTDTVLHNTIATTNLSSPSSVSLHQSSPASIAQSIRLGQSAGQKSVPISQPPSGQSSPNSFLSNTQVNTQQHTVQSGGNITNQSNSGIVKTAIKIPSASDIVAQTTTSTLNQTVASSKEQTATPLPPVMQHLQTTISSPQSIASSPISSLHTTLPATAPLGSFTSTPLHTISQTSSLHDIARAVNIQVPTLKDITSVEQSVSSGRSTQSMTNFITPLKQLANPLNIPEVSHREKMITLHSKLQSLQEHNTAAKTVLNAAALATVPIDSKKETLATIAPAIKEMLPRTSVQSGTDADYDAVKTQWQNYYKSAPVPAEGSTQPISRIDWLKQEKEHAATNSTLLTSTDPIAMGEGFAMLSQKLILFTLGGFSLGDMIRYLKIKMEAAQEVLSQLLGQAESEHTPGEAADTSTAGNGEIKTEE